MNKTKVISIINKEDTKEFKEFKGYLKEKGIDFEVNAINNNTFKIIYEYQTLNNQTQIRIFKDLLKEFRMEFPNQEEVHISVQNHQK